MDTVRDFEDFLELLDRHDVRYLIVGGLAFIFHAKPRYTKDMDIWLGPGPGNSRRANEALSQFGAPELLDPDNPDEILQLGVAPNRIDLLRDMIELDFDTLWERRIDHPRHREDVRILEMVRDGRAEDE